MNTRLGEERDNYQECLMRIIEYNGARNIVVEFQDMYMAKVHTSYQWFKEGRVKNPYIPSVYNVGITGNKYPTRLDGKQTKEYKTWIHLLERCFNDKVKTKHPTYQNVTCCKDWLLFDNFYEWLHSQDNFDKWFNGDRWALDKDILIKGNKHYSCDTCCLVPININSMFTKSNATRGFLPIGVIKEEYGFRVTCNNPLTNKTIHVGVFLNSDEAFKAYKETKESFIKQVAEAEFNKGNITIECYNAMMNYEVDIND